MTILVNGNLVLRERTGPILGLLCVFFYSHKRDYYFTFTDVETTELQRS